jgi:hypothetical protein
MMISFLFDPINYYHSNAIPQVVSTSPNLTLTVTQETIGGYFCKASVPGYADIVEQATVYLKGVPTITSARRQFGTPGDAVHVECIAFSIPKARFVSWSFNGRDINNASGDEFKIHEEPLPYGVKSTLVIERSSASRHFGRYNCTVINDYGSDLLEIELNGESKCKLLAAAARRLGLVDTHPRCSALSPAQITRNSSSSASAA